MVFWPTTVLWKLKLALYTLKADTTLRVLVEVHKTSYGLAFLESLISPC
jgi:hypothetical protein